MITMQTKKLLKIFILFFFGSLLTVPLVSAEPIPVEYFFEKGCPTCEQVKQNIDYVEDYYNDTIAILRYDVSQNDTYLDWFKDYNLKSTPAVVVNYSIILNTSQLSIPNLQQAINASLTGDAEPDTDLCNITTFIGTINVCEYSLPVLTIVLGAIDSFNPCSFFILLFLLNLLLYVDSKRRMLFIGSIFIFISGFIYLLMMILLFQASSELYKLIDQNTVVSIIIGIIALFLGGLMVKDFFFFKKGPSLSISEEKKKDLFKRMRSIVHAPSLISVIIGTITLAVLANTYELICTLAIPFSYVGTLQSVYSITTLFPALPYLLLYNVVYVIPLLIIVGAFTWKFDKNKLSEWQGRLLKLFSGMMMSFLGVTFLLFPQALKNSMSILSIILAALLATIIIQFLTKFYKRKKSN